MTSTQPPIRRAPRPCGGKPGERMNCPWRRDSRPDDFPTEGWERLRCTSNQSWLGAPLFACHKSPDGNDLACAGWLAVAGHENFAVRLAVIQGRLDPQVFDRPADWPELYESYDEMVAAKTDPPDANGEQA